MRLGGPLVGVDACATGDPDRWAAAHKPLGYSASYFPWLEQPTTEKARAYSKAAEKHGLLIAEVGAWCNPIDPDPIKAQQAIKKCILYLQIAEEAGARCCVNIVGSRNPTQWDGPDRNNLTQATFDLVVQTTRTIIDAVNPKRTFYTLETMPWIFPDSPENYLRLLEAIDRPGFGVHLDPVNLVNCPSRYYDTGALIDRCFDLLGPHIKSVHGKDIVMEGRLTVHLDECRPGLGGLDYKTFLTRLSRLDPQTPLMLEHLPTAEEYAMAAVHIRNVAGEIGVDVI